MDNINLEVWEATGNKRLHAEVLGALSVLQQSVMVTATVAKAGGTLAIAGASVDSGAPSAELTLGHLVEDAGLAMHLPIQPAPRRPTRAVRLRQGVQYRL